MTTDEDGRFDRGQELRVTSTGADPVLLAGVTPVRLVHLTDLRSALAEAYVAAGRAVPRWADASPPAESTPSRATHVTELRAAVLALK